MVPPRAPGRAGRPRPLVAPEPTRRLYAFQLGQVEGTHRRQGHGVPPPLRAAAPVLRLAVAHGGRAWMAVVASMTACRRRNWSPCLNSETASASWGCCRSVTKSRQTATPRKHPSWPPPWCRHRRGGGRRGVAAGEPGLRGATACSLPGRLERRRVYTDHASNPCRAA